MTEKPWISKAQTGASIELQDLREQVAQLKLKEEKFNFLLASMSKMCVHYNQQLTSLPDGRMDVLLIVQQIHDLEKDRGVRHVRVDIESFDEQLAIYMKESGK